jgi:hypothetical protein
MKTWQKILILTLISFAIGGLYLLSVWKHRQDPGVIGRNNASQTLSQDDLVVLRSFFPAHFDDLQRLEGTTVWMQNGYTIPYFPYVGGQVEFSKRVGLIPSAQRLDVKKIVKASVPANVDDGIEHGSRQGPLRHTNWRHAGKRGSLLHRYPVLLRRPARDLHPLAEGCVGGHRCAPGEAGHE